MNASQQKWDNIYQHKSVTGDVVNVLLQHLCLLPDQGLALDLACGLGANALKLAQSGLSTEAWDFSSVALTKLQSQARAQNVNIQTKLCNINSESFTNQRFDVIVISRFLDRSLSNAIIAALKNGGLLFYQTFTQNKITEQGPSNPDYLLQTNELLRLFAPLSTVFYQEYAGIGDTQKGERNEVMYIGQKLEQ